MRRCMVFTGCAALLLLALLGEAQADEGAPVAPAEFTYGTALMQAFQLIFLLVVGGKGIEKSGALDNTGRRVDDIERRLAETRERYVTRADLKEMETRTLDRLTASHAQQEALRAEHIAQGVRLGVAEVRLETLVQSIEKVEKGLVELRGELGEVRGQNHEILTILQGQFGGGKHVR